MLSQPYRVGPPRPRLAAAAVFTAVALAACGSEEEPDLLYQAVPVSTRDIIVSAEAAGVVEDQMDLVRLLISLKVLEDVVAVTEIRERQLQADADVCGVLVEPPQVILLGVVLSLDEVRSAELVERFGEIDRIDQTVLVGGSPLHLGDDFEPGGFAPRGVVAVVLDEGESGRSDTVTKHGACSEMLRMRWPLVITGALPEEATTARFPYATEPQARRVAHGI